MTSKKKDRYLLLFILGVTIVLVPQLIIFFNDSVQDSEINQYLDSISDLPDEKIQQFFTEATSINKNSSSHSASDDGDASHESSTDSSVNTAEGYPVIDPFTNQMTSGGNQPSLIAEDDVFAFIEIPKIGEILPIYLGATTNNLSNGVAQVTGSSLPTGGVSTHSVIAGHRGYYGATFFRYIDQLQQGDRFYIHVLNRVLTYKVSGQAIIEPDDTSSLAVVEGKDLVTLLSCTPYPTNRYRLLIYGTRIADDVQSSNFTATSESSIDEYSVSDRRVLAEEMTGSEANNETGKSQTGESLLAEQDGSYQTEEATVVDEETKTKKASIPVFSEQSFWLNGDVSSVARNHKLINRLVILAGLLTIFYCIGIIYRNKRKQSQ